MPVTKGTLREGDVVHVRAVVVQEFYSDVERKMVVKLYPADTDRYSHFFAGLEVLEMVHPKFDVGEVVRYKGNRKAILRIKAIVGDQAWIETLHNDDLDQVVPLDVLERAPDLVQAEVEDLGEDRGLSPSDPGYRAVMNGVASDPNVDETFTESLAQIMDVKTWEVAEGETRRNPDGSYTATIGPFQRGELRDPGFGQSLADSHKATRGEKA